MSYLIGSSSESKALVRLGLVAVMSASAWPPAARPFPEGQIVFVSPSFVLIVQLRPLFIVLL